MFRARVRDRVDLAEVDGVGRRGERNGRVAGLVQPLQARRPVGQDGERQAEHVAHRDTDGPPVERIRAGRRHQYCVDAHRRSRAKPCTDVRVIDDVVQNRYSRNRRQAVEQRLQRRRRLTPVRRQRAPVHMESGDLLSQLEEC